MKQYLLLVFLVTMLFFSCQDNNRSKIPNITVQEKSLNKEDAIAPDKEDGIAAAQKMEFERTKDISLGYIPKYRLIQSTEDLKNARQNGTYPDQITSLSWTERGSYTDAVGPSNGNGRPGVPTPVTGGRMRTIWPDLDNPQIVWAAGVDGGLWKTTNITSSPATWTVVNDFFGNLAIGSICQDPSNHSVMYFGTGEKTFNVDAVQGGGVWKSTDHGVTWNLLANTTGFWNISKIICDNAGNIYVGTIGSGDGLQRSTNGGTSWTNITPTINAGGGGNINTTRVADMTYDPVSNKLHVVMGYFPAVSTIEGYCFTTTPSTVTSATWTAATTTFITTAGSVDNCAIVCNGNTVYATPANTSDIVPTIYKSTNGGVNWAATGATPTNAGNNAYTNGQGWYCLALGVDPSNANNVIVGSLNCYKTTNGGTSWSQISVWVSGISGTVTQYVHADQHIVTWNTNQVLIGSDGGIFYSADGGATFSDRNVNLRIKQFYSCAIHPSSTDYFLAGAQDNGVHQFNAPGIASSVEVSGGDGALVAIDQNEPSYQFGTYVFNHYHRSTNSGSTWSDFDFYKGSAPINYTEFGSFINAYDYDDQGNAIYAGADGGEFFRWTNPQTLAPGTYHAGGSGFPAGVSLVTITALNSEFVSTVKVSPFTLNRVYFGTDAGRVVRVDNANTIASGSAGTNLTGVSFPAGATVSCINAGTSDNNLIVTFSNYGVNNVWVSTDGGTNWTAIDGNLPDMPVRWAIFYPNDNTKVILATEMGIYETSFINGASTIWAQNPSFPVVRTDMLKYRNSDRTVLAATHGRGLWSTTIPTALPVTLVDIYGNLLQKNIVVSWVTASEDNSNYFELQKSTDGVHFFVIGNVNAAGNSVSPITYHFNDDHVNEFNYYRLRIVDKDGRFVYSKIILIKDPGAQQDVRVVNNPFNSYLDIRLARPIQKTARFELINMSGVMVYKKEFGIASEIRLDFSSQHLGSGIYILKSNIDGKIFTSKVFRQ